MLHIGGPNPLLYRIMHVENVAAMLQDRAMACRAKAKARNYVPIGNSELIDKRKSVLVPVPPGGCLSDYVPFYFTPHSVMLFNIHTNRVEGVSARQEDIVIAVSSLGHLEAHRLEYVVTDRNAVVRTACFHHRRAGLEHIDWNILRQRDFQRDPEKYPDKIERYHAECLVHDRVPLEALAGLACHNDATAKRLEELVTKKCLSLKVAIKRAFYF